MKYGITHFNEDKLTDVVFGDGRTGIFSIGFKEGVAGLQLRRDGKEPKPFWKEENPSKDLKVDANKFGDHQTVRLLFDNKRSIDIMIKMLEESKDNLPD